jgi:hypothetical protein
MQILCSPARSKLQPLVTNSCYICYYSLLDLGRKWCLAGPMPIGPGPHGGDCYDELPRIVIFSTHFGEYACSYPLAPACSHKDHSFGGCADPHNPLRCSCGRGVRSPYAQGVRAYESAVVVRIFLIGCAVLLLVVGCAGSQSGAPPKEDQGHIEATKEGHEHTEATASEEEARCEGTRKANVNLPVRFTTNDLPGCPKGGLLSGTDKPDELAGEKGDDEVRGLGGSDDIIGGDGNDVLYGGSGRDGVGGYDGDDIIYGGPGNDGKLPSPIVAGHGGDDVIYGGPGDDGNLVGFGGKDVIYGGPGDDTKLDVASAGEFGNDGQRDKLYCGKGQDTYYAEKIDYVASSCEVKLGNSAPGPDDSMKPIE